MSLISSNPCTPQGPPRERLIEALQEADDLPEALCHALVQVRNLFHGLGFREIPIENWWKLGQSEASPILGFRGFCTMLQVILHAANDITCRMLQDSDDLPEALCHALVEVRHLFQHLGLRKMISRNW